MNNTITFGSLFTGIGGFDLGFERAGLKCEWQVEINPFCRKVLHKHWPEVRKHDDIRTFPRPCYECFRRTGDHNHECDGCDCRRRLWNVDIICGGDPCQGNSNAGSVHKKKHADMGTEFLRVVGVLRPRVVVRENPYAARPDALWPWWRMRSELERLGYRVLPFRLRACCVGADHRRDRVFLLGELADTDGKRLEGFDRQRQSSRHVSRTCRDDCRDQRGDSLPASRICRGVDGIPHRMERTTAIGNAVDVRVSEWIGRRLKTVMETTG